MNQIKTVLFAFVFMSFGQSIVGQRIMGQIMKDAPPVLMQPPDINFHPDAKVLGPGLFSHLRPVTELYSATNKQFAGTNEGNLYIRNTDSDNYSLKLAPKEGWYWHMDNAMWSPNGNFLIAKQIDDRAVNIIKLTHETSDHISYKPYSKAGGALPIHQFYIININSGKAIAIKQHVDFPYIHMLGWHDGSKKLHIVESDRFMKTLNLLDVDVQTGQSKILLTEKSDTFLIGLNLLQGYSKRLIDMKLVTFLDDKKHFIWMSERTGYQQLYLYDYEGKLILPLTSLKDNGIVERITHMDTSKNLVYFLAHGDLKNRYKTQLYSSSLQAEQINQVIKTSGIVDVLTSTNKDTLWVLRSELPKVLQLDIYVPENKSYDIAWRGDLSMLDDRLFNYEYVQVLADDHKSEIEILLLKPIEFDPNKTYPVIEYIYGAPNDTVVPHDLFSPWLWDKNGLAQEGFIIVLIDGRGTSGKGKAFLDYGYGQFGQHVIKEHVTTIKQLASERPYMNLDKVGVIGHSWGGYFAMRALLEAPEFYKAGHINAAAINLEDFRVPIEVYMGCIPKDCPDSYSEFRITDQLDNLQANLMIIHGTADDDVPIENAYNLIKALKTNGYENYEFKEYQGMNHIVMRNQEWQPEMINFFKQHLN